MRSTRNEESVVTARHEVLHRIVQERPEILVPAFRNLGVPLPNEAAIERLSADCTEILPLERRVDGVLRLRSDEGESLLLAIEAQGRRDRDKERSWAHYVAYLESKHQAPTLLLVLCDAKATADWAAGPFRLGPKSWPTLTVRPLVIGPEQLPIIKDEKEAAENLALATLSACVHGRDPANEAILKTLARTLGAAEDDDAHYYAQMMEGALGSTTALEMWRTMMKIYFPGAGTLIEERYLEGKAEGEAKGEAKAVLRVLQVRGIPVPDDVRERITICTDMDTLDRWLDRAVSVTRAEDLFAEGSA
jgi:hypothetical protein